MSNMVVNTNVLALNSHRSIKNVGVMQGKASEKLSSGLRINRAADDASGLAISEKMRSQIRGLDQASSNAQDGISLIQTAEGALQETHQMLQRMRELVVMASDDKNETGDREKIAMELDELTKEIDETASITQFNKKPLINGDWGSKEVYFQTGANSGQGLSFNIQNMDSKALGVTISEIADIVRGSGVKTGDMGTKSEFTASDLDTAFGVLSTAIDSSGGITGGAAALMIMNGADGGNTLDNVSQLKNGTLLTDGANIFKVSVDSTSGEVSVTEGTPDALSTSASTTADIKSGAAGDVLDTVDGIVFKIGSTPGSGEFTASVTLYDASGAEIPDGQSIVYGNSDVYYTEDGRMIELTGADSENAEFSVTAIEYTTNSPESVGTIGKDATGGLVGFDGTFTILDTDGNATSDVFSVTDGVFSGSGTGYDFDDSASTAHENSSFTAKDASDNEFVFSFGTDGKVTVTMKSAQPATGSAGRDPAAEAAQEKYEAALTELNNNTNASYGQKISLLLDKVDGAIEAVSTQRAKLGSYQNRLEHTIKNLDVASENLSNAESRIRDTDMAKEMMNFTKSNVLQQAATSMLAQANQAPQNVLQLLR